MGTCGEECCILYANFSHSYPSGIETALLKVFDRIRRLIDVLIFEGTFAHNCWDPHRSFEYRSLVWSPYRVADGTLSARLQGFFEDVYP